MLVPNSSTLPRFGFRLYRVVAGYARLKVGVNLIDIKALAGT